MVGLVRPQPDAINTPDAVTVSGGNLTITTYTANGTHYSGIISSDGRFRARYGYLEASIQFSTSRGMWSAFWLQSPNEGQFIGDTSASGAEIDICEHRKTDAQRDNITARRRAPSTGTATAPTHKQVNSGNIGSGLGAGFHTYGLLWTRTNYSFLIDGAHALEHHHGAFRPHGTDPAQLGGARTPPGPGWCRPPATAIS